MAFAMIPMIGIWRTVMLDFDINRDLPEDAAEEYSEDEYIRPWFVQGWLAYCSGRGMMANPYGPSGAAWQDGWIAARDAPE